MGPVDGILNMLLVRLWPSRFRLSCTYLAALFVLVGSSHIGFEPSAASYGAPKCQIVLSGVGQPSLTLSRYS